MLRTCQLPASSPMRTRWTRLQRLAILIGFVLLLAGTAFPQANTGQISGTVSDSSGAVVPGAAVAAVSDETHLESKTTTDGSGHYLVINLPVGTYSVRVEANGFRKV